MDIRIFVTGGTFDKEYDMIRGELYFKDTHLPEILQIGRCSLTPKIRTLMMVDSLEMTDEDRQLIAHNCAKCVEELVIITHGTDTMVKTARIIAQQQLPKTIILTGAMIPYKFGASDGFFNLGSALAFVQTLPHGVYVVMNGRYFQWDNVRKNYDIGFFEALDE